MYYTTALTLFASFRWLVQQQNKTKIGSHRQRLCARLSQEPPVGHHLNFALGRNNGPLSQQFIQAELSSLEARASTLSQSQLSDQNAQLWGVILEDRTQRISKVGLLQPTAAEWLKQAAATKIQLQHFISQAYTPVNPEEKRHPETLNLQDQGKIINSEYWVKDDPRLNQWLSYPGVSVMLQRTQSVMDLLEEISTQAPLK